MKNTISYIISNILDDDSGVSIEEEEIDGITNFKITSPKEKIGRIIGKEGRIIRAIRNIMRIPAIKQGKRINITLNETE